MQKIIASLLILTLSACGWHLRGSTTNGDKLAMTTPLNLVITSEDNHTPLTDALRQSLQPFNITEINSPTADSLTLSLQAEIMDKRTAGVGSNALTSAYEIILTVDYAVSNQAGVITPLNTRARVSRSYDYNVNNANSAAREEELVLREMRRELAQTILRRTKTLSAKPSPSTKPAAAH
uniref:LPS-assembly lipoprotein LptE n=1 Tax=Cellvibrio fontiphilus TaxID=1815559 RepID=UPI002B4BD1A2|nr:LPS assembly lipoprotein LptE [Cellvibrio fontiphilus]